VLGRKAGPRPFFDFRGATETEDAFTRTTVAMEDLTVALLTGVTPQIHDQSLTAALFGLITVEARHAAWARHLVGTTPAAQAFDEPRPVPAVASLIADTHFIVNRPRTRRRRHSPRFTG
jgi:ferritin-like protein